MPVGTGRPAWRSRLAAALLLATAFAIRLASLQGGGLGIDVGWALGLSWLPVDAMLDLTARDAHPPLLYLLLRGWTVLAGQGRLATDYLALALSTASVAVLYALGARVGGPPGGVVAAVLLAFSPYHLYYTKSRYPLPIFFGALSLYLLLRLVNRPPRAAGGARCAAAAWLPYFLVSLVSVYLSYFSVAPLAAHGLYLLWRRHWRLLAQWLLAGALMFVAFLPWLLFVLPRHLGTQWGSSGGGPPYWPLDPFSGDLARTLSFFFALEPLVTPPLWTYTVAAGLLLLGATLLARRRQPPPPRALGLLGGVLAVSIGFASLATVYWTKGGLGGRYPAMGLPAFLVLLAVALVIIFGRRRWLLAAATGLLLALWVGAHSLQLQVRPDHDDLETLAQIRQLAVEQIPPSDLAVFTTVAYGGFYQSWFGAARSWALVMTDPFFFRPYPPETVDRAARALLDSVQGRRRALWVFYLGGSNEVNAPLRAVLREAAYPAGHTWFPYILAMSYSLPRAPMVGGPSGVAFQSGVVLDAVSYTGEAASGGSVNVALTWRATAPLVTSYKVFVHLVDGDGRRWAQHDDYPDNGERPTVEWAPGDVVRDHQGLLLPADLPAGDYRLVVGLSSGQGRLRLLDGADSLAIGSVHIGPQG